LQNLRATHKLKGIKVSRLTRMVGTRLQCEASMTDFPTRQIREVVQQLCSKGDIVDATAVAEIFQQEYPDYGLDVLTASVIEEVALMRGNAQWERRLNG